MKACSRRRKFSPAEALGRATAAVRRPARPRQQSQVALLALLSIPRGDALVYRLRSSSMKTL